ncbi:MAG: CoA transferase, partial [Dehalococcoidia bacterium]
FISLPSAHWMRVLSEQDVPVGPVYFVEELLDHEQVVANGLVVDVDHPLLGPLKMVGPAFQMSETPITVKGPSPMLGEHTESVLAELGYGEGEIDALRGAGVIA